MLIFDIHISVNCTEYCDESVIDAKNDILTITSDHGAVSRDILQGSVKDSGATLVPVDGRIGVTLTINADDVRVVEIYLWFKGANTLVITFNDVNSTVCMARYYI